MRERKHVRGRTNVALLFGAYGLSQGAMFLAQTWLVLSGELRFVGLFGLSLSLASLACLMMDWGGMVLLAKQELAGASDEESNILYWNLSSGRIILSLVAGVILLATLRAEDGFGADYALAAAPSLLMAAFSPAGIVDGLHRSGANGIVSALPVLFSALLLVPAARLPSDTQAYLLGAAFTFGTAVGLVLQLVVITRAGRRLRFAAPEAKRIWTALGDGGLILLTSLPSVLLYRAQVALSASMLGPAATGLFVYAKQIGNTILQGAQFIRRAEFPGLMASLQSGIAFRPILQAQRTSLAFGILASIALALAGVFARYFPTPGLGMAALLAAAFAPAISASTFYAAALQIFIGLGRVRVAAAVPNVGVLAAVLVMAPAISWFGLYGLALVEFALNILAFLALSLLLQRARRRPAAEPLEDEGNETAA